MCYAGLSGGDFLLWQDIGTRVRFFYCDLFVLNNCLILNHSIFRISVPIFYAPLFLCVTNVISHDSLQNTEISRHDLTAQHTWLYESTGKSVQKNWWAGNALELLDKFPPQSGPQNASQIFSTGQNLKLNKKKKKKRRSLCLRSTSHYHT